MSNVTVSGHTHSIFSLFFFHLHAPQPQAIISTWFFAPRPADHATCPNAPHKLWINCIDTGFEYNYFILNGDSLHGTEIKNVNCKLWNNKATMRGNEKWFGEKYGCLGLCTAYTVYCTTRMWNGEVIRRRFYGNHLPTYVRVHLLVCMSVCERHRTEWARSNSSRKKWRCPL